MTGGIITAPQPEAVEAGCRRAGGGGNAVDAAVACALVQTVVDPLMCGQGRLRVVGGRIGGPEAR